MVDFSKFKKSLQANPSPAPTQEDIRSRFKKRSEETLETTYKDRDKRSKAGSLGKSIFSREALEKYGFTEFQVKPGSTFIDILPLSFDPAHPYFREMQVHFQVGFSQDAFICPHRLNGERCPRCEKQQKLYREKGDGPPTDEIKKLYPTDRVIYLVLDRTKELAANESPTTQIQVWNAAKGAIHKEIHSRTRDKLTQKNIDITDLTVGGEGRHVGFDMEKQKSYPKYSGFDLYERQSPVPDDVVLQLSAFIEEAESQGYVGDKIVDLLLHFPTYDEIKESQETEGMVADTEDPAIPGDETPQEKEMTPAQKRLAALKAGKKPEPPKKSQEEIAAELVAKYEKLQTELEAMNMLKWNQWINSTGKEYKESITGMSKAEAVPAIVEDLLNNEAKSLGIDIG